MPTGVHKCVFTGDVLFLFFAKCIDTACTVTGSDRHNKCASSFPFSVSAAKAPLSLVSSCRMESSPASKLGDNQVEGLVHLSGPLRLSSLLLQHQ